MLDAPEDIAATASNWLAHFERALTERDDGALTTLFHPDSYWRDVLALTWSIDTVSGRESHRARRWRRTPARARRPTASRWTAGRTAPRKVMRAGTNAIEAIFRFETHEGVGSGVLRLVPDADDGNTSQGLDAAHRSRRTEGVRGAGSARRGPPGSPIRAISAAPTGSTSGRRPPQYADRDPTVLVVGGGQAGLSIAARLTQLGVDTLIVDRWPRIGDNWRQRYHALTLHNQVQVNHLPYMPFPPSWPTYIPKDKLASWFEAYVESLELNYWTDTELEGGSYDEKDGRWTVELRRAGAKRTMHPRHIVMATGVSGIPNLPDIPTLRSFRGKVLHSSQYDDGEDWKGANVLVVGTGNSGHDIAQDLYSSGAKVTLAQRSSTWSSTSSPVRRSPTRCTTRGRRWRTAT